MVASARQPPSAERRRPVDAARLRTNFAQVAGHGDEVPLYFYSDLFLRHPEVRDMFPVCLEAQRGHFAGLVKIVSHADSASDLTRFLEALGRDHRGFGVAAESYEAMGTSLLATLRHFSGSDWTPELHSDWVAAYELIGSVMRAAAAAEPDPGLAWWRAVAARQDAPADVGDPDDPRRREKVFAVAGAARAQPQTTGWWSES
jgi:hemoglobin-like flavoprotein